jgi:hypothetical protein
MIHPPSGSQFIPSHELFSLGESLAHVTRFHPLVTSTPCLSLSRGLLEHASLFHARLERFLKQAQKALLAQRSQIAQQADMKFALLSARMDMLKTVCHIIPALLKQATNARCV